MESGLPSIHHAVVLIVRRDKKNCSGEVIEIHVLISLRILVDTPSASGGLLLSINLS